MEGTGGGGRGGGNPGSPGRRGEGAQATWMAVSRGEECKWSGNPGDQCIFIDDQQRQLDNMNKDASPIGLAAEPRDDAALDGAWGDGNAQIVVGEGGL